MPARPCVQHPERFIRKANLCDIDRCCELLGQLAEVEQVFVHDPAAYRNGLEAILRRKDAVILLACLKNKIIGMLSCQIVISTAMGGPAGLVEDVVVDQPFRGLGYGSALLEALEVWAKKHNLSRLCLLADRENISAHGFYHQHHWHSSLMQAWYLGLDDD